ncbi:MAG TPA: SOS response-associated peptidase [Allosphingosinicella sp.]|nr:SOS response-associated peptidase [Allosphingosinicella sp.]
MCNDYRLIERVPAETLFPNVLAPEGIPNFEPRADIRITDRAPILRAATDKPGAVELVQRRWSWPGPGGKPVFNYRADGREFPKGRCIILADGFYEFTAHADPKSKTKHKWLFTLQDHDWFGIAGLWRHDAGIGEEAFTMLTIEPHPDVAPYHNRGISILGRTDMARWLDPAIPARELLKPLPAGSLLVTQVA